MRIEHIGDATLYLADCMDIMRDMPDKAFDLAIVDPPYGINWMEQIENPNTGKNWKIYEKKEWDSSAPTKEYFEELFRVSKNQIIWGGNYFDLPATPCYLAWDKMQEFSGATFELAWTSFKSPAKAFRMSRVEAYVGQNKIHPTQKPVALYKWLLSRYAKPGDTILDTHGGSGSSVIACMDSGHAITWIEKDEDYFNAALERIEIAYQQPRLFEEPKKKVVPQELPL
jgi:site-specific DNA-methyltransferase (adenine-specific)